MVDFLWYYDRIHAAIFAFHLHRVNWEDSIVPTDTTEIRSNRVLRNSTEVHSDQSPSSDISHERQTFIIVYSCIIALGAFCYISRAFSFYRMCIRISINFHDMIFRGISRAKMIFFNNNPSGRILNRFAGDINSVDTLLPIVMVDVFDVSSFNLFYFP